MYYIQLVPCPFYQMMFHPPHHSDKELEIEEDDEEELKSPRLITSRYTSTIDILICCYKEDENTIARTLRHCSKLVKPEGVKQVNIYLLDDLGKDTRPALCQVFGATYVCRPNRCVRSGSRYCIIAH
jgi:cellulose synthase/poly-beta-1,6-N-acetylglucosamine synthase-like glycosyltransferase